MTIIHNTRIHTHTPRAITCGTTSRIQANSQVWATACSFLDSMDMPITFLLLNVTHTHVRHTWFSVKNVLPWTNHHSGNLPARQTNNCAVEHIGCGIVPSISHNPLGNNNNKDIIYIHTNNTHTLYVLIINIPPLVG